MTDNEENVVQLQMTNEDYAKARAELGERKDATAKWDQQLAALFLRSRWTQEQLAKKEGKSQRWVSYHLLFGRFLTFSTTVLNAENTPNNLSERKFREYWEKTEGTNERQRFIAVQKLMAPDLTLRHAKRPKIGPAILEQFGNGKWHSAEKIAERLDTSVDHVESTFHTMMVHETYGSQCERKNVGKNYHYRIFPRQKTVSSMELTEKLGPLIEQLKAEGKKSVDTMSPGTVARLAALLQKLLDAWAK